MVLEVMIYGLLAIVPNDPISPSQLEILVLDVSQRKSSDGCPLHEHQPLLLFESKDGKCTRPCYPRSRRRASTASGGDPYPDRTPGSLCTCDLANHVVSLKGSPPIRTDFRIPRPPNHLDKYNQGDAGWIVRLSDVASDSGAIKHPTRLPPGLVVGRVSLPVSRLSTCLLATDDDSEYPATYIVHFRDLWGGPMSGGRRAVAEAILVTAEYFIEPDVGVYVDGGPDPVGAVCTREGGCGVAFVSNEMPTFPPPPDPDVPDYCYDYDLGRDFEVFFDLAKSPATRNEAPVPWRFVSQDGLPANACTFYPVFPVGREDFDVLKVLVPPICPPALFNEAPPGAFDEAPN